MAAPPVAAELAARLDRLAAKAFADGDVAGISIAVVWHGATVLAKGYGVADAEHGTAVDADTVFRIGSITKQFTAAAILRLAADGSLAVDDPLTRYLPDYPVHGRAITLRHLLTHTSGIKDYEHGAWLAAHMAEARPATELIASFAAEPFDFEPGTQWSYSNSGYFLLGQIIERLTGHSYAATVDAMVAAAHVDGVRYCADQQDAPHAARGYQRGAGGARVPAAPIRMMHVMAAGAMCATASGLVAWAQALAGGRVVTPAAWAEMTTPVRLANGDHHDYGFGLFTGRLGDHRMIFHSGGINGFVAKLSSYPDDELYVAVLVNTESNAADALDDALAREVLGVAPPPPTLDLPVDATEAAAVAGRYLVAAAGATLVIEADGGTLYVRTEGDAERATLRRQADGSYVAAASSLVTLRFVRAGDRVVGLELVQAGMAFAGTRLP